MQTALGTWLGASEMQTPMSVGVPASLDRQMKTTCQSNDTQEPSAGQASRVNCS